MYEVFNAIAHICMIILAFEVLFLLVVPALAIGLGGLLGLRLVRGRVPDWAAGAGKLPRRGLALIDRLCDAAAWPVIQGTSLWRGAKVALASLRRQAASDNN